jgi:hypothetical protein
MPTSTRSPASASEPVALRPLLVVHLSVVTQMDWQPYSVVLRGVLMWLIAWCLMWLGLVWEAFIFYTGGVMLLIAGGIATVLNRR